MKTNIKLQQHLRCKLRRVTWGTSRMPWFEPLLKVAKSLLLAWPWAGVWGHREIRHRPFLPAGCCLAETARQGWPSGSRDVNTWLRAPNPSSSRCRKKTEREEEMAPQKENPYFDDRVSRWMAKCFFVHPQQKSVQGDISLSWVPGKQRLTGVTKVPCLSNIHIRSVKQSTPRKASSGKSPHGTYLLINLKSLSLGFRTSEFHQGKKKTLKPSRF